MKLKTSRKHLFGTLVVVLLLINVAISIHLLRAASKQGAMWAASSESGGELRIRGKKGEILGACPLQHTDVDADIVGSVTRVRVRQTFANPLDQKVEAVYVFPLPENSAVDEMTMTIGSSRIVGKVKPKEQARKTYEAAKAAGHVASLLDQERPNVFTQSVANIEPGAQVVIEISYVETLKYQDGVFEFVFPMVVGPRYVPGGRGTGTSKINPPIAPPTTRTGHDIRMTVRIDGNSELFDIKSELHEINVQSVPGQAVVNLRNDGEIPNRDFILRYRTATEQIKDAFFVHPFPGGAYFTLLLQPPRRVTAEQARPKEMIFVIDRSGSQEGFPLKKAKETMRQCIEGMNPRDTFNLISFSDDTTELFDRPQPNTAANREKALDYLDSLQATGGTEMSEVMLKALKRTAEKDRIRIVCFMTDGFVENDFEILAAVEEHAGTARVFSFGIGNSVNRFLLDGLAHAGRGRWSM